MKNKKRTINIVFIVIIFLLCSMIISTYNRYNHTKEEVHTLKESIKSISTLNETLEKENKTLKEEKVKLEEKIEQLNKDLIDNSKAIYNNQDVTKKSNITYNQLRLALEDYNMQKLAKYIIEAEKEYKVNALFLAGLIANETGYGTSRRYLEDNNVGGYEVYTASSKGRIFDSKEESVYEVARLLSEDYLDEDGIYHNGKSSYSINILYCKSTSSGDAYDWHRTIDKIANELKDKINSNFKH